MRSYKLVNENEERDLPANSDNTTSEGLGVYYRIRETGLTLRVGGAQRLGKPGEVITGDQQENARDITIEMYLSRTKDVAESEFLDYVNEFADFFRLENQPVYLVEQDQSRRTKIALQGWSWDTTADNMERLSEQIDWDCRQLNASWEDEDEVEVSTGSGGIATGENLVLTNDSFRKAWPRFVIRPISSTISDFTLTLDSGESIRITNSGFIPGTELVLDFSGTGEFMFSDITGTDADARNLIADNTGPFPIQPGSNSIQYTSLDGDVEIDVTFRRNYAR